MIKQCFQSTKNVITYNAIIIEELRKSLPTYGYSLYK